MTGLPPEICWRKRFIPILAMRYRMERGRELVDALQLASAQTNGGSAIDALDTIARIRATTTKSREILLPIEQRPELATTKARARQ